MFDKSIISILQLSTRVSHSLFKKKDWSGFWCLQWSVRLLSFRTKRTVSRSTGLQAGLLSPHAVLSLIHQPFNSFNRRLATLCVQVSRVDQVWKGDGFCPFLAGIVLISALQAAAGSAGNRRSSTARAGSPGYSSEGRGTVRRSLGTCRISWYRYIWLRFPGRRCQSGALSWSA